jgi:FdhE protein
MKWSLDDRIARASELAKTHPAAGDLLSFYRQLALFQKSVNAADMQALVSYFPALLALVRREGPQPLADFGGEHLQTPEAQLELLLAVWEHHASDEAGRFFARVLLQPYAEHLASRGPVLIDGEVAAEPICPFCSARPVAGVLRGEGDGAKRWLLCSMCSTEWPFRRVVCPYCGEQDKEKLPVYIASDFDHVRVEACDSCNTYIKSVDLTKDGHAVPVVDELATVPLNIWAENHGYAKLESNLLGL